MHSIDSAFDMRRCSLYNALAGYSLYRQAETSGYNARELNEALHAIDDAIRCNASPADFYRIKSMILVKLHKDDLAKENDAVFADKQRQNEEPQVNDEVRSIK
ncbi:MAG: hypothetical protein KGS72_13080 [Cyanobacteria bacterium REEB67]|nr:hypothetical protein [Cyanobacteria bacterium REEB67]